MKFYIKVFIHCYHSQIEKKLYLWEGMPVCLYRMICGIVAHC